MSALKLVIGFWLIVSSFFIVAKPTLAQNYATQSATVPLNAQNFQGPQQTQYSLVNFIHAFSCLTAGNSPIGQPCLNYIQKEGSNGSFYMEPVLSQVNNSGGILGVFTNGISFMLTHRPASGIDYLARSVNDLSNVGVARAQVGGAGAEVIRPVERIWKVSRNISYVVVTLILVVIGLMIMFQRKINPQTVVSIQQALPGVIASLVLITFSYFIAGFIIDLAFVFTQLLGIIIISSLAPTGNPAFNNPTNSAAIVSGILDTNNIFGLFAQFLKEGDLAGAAGTLGDVVGAILNATPEIQAVVFTIVGIATITAAGGGWTGWIVGAITGTATAVIPDTIAAALAIVVLFVGLLQAIFRLFLGLINAYVAIILNTIFGPFLILSSAVPGGGNAINGWMKSLIANVLVFPAVFGMFVLVAAILGFGHPWPWNGSSPVGPITQTFPLMGNLPDQFLRYILAYGIILASPGIPELIQQKMNAQGPQQLNQAITAATQAGTQFTTGIITRGLRVITPS